MTGRVEYEMFLCGVVDTIIHIKGFDVLVQCKVWYGDMPANQIIVAHPQAMDEVSHAVQILAQIGGLKRLVRYEE